MNREYGGDWSIEMIWRINWEKEKGKWEKMEDI